MKKSIALLLGIIMMATIAAAQTIDSASIYGKNSLYTGAKADHKKYHAIFQMDSNDPKIIDKAFHNINNALTDPRLAGNIEIEVIAFSAGTDIYMLGSKYENDLKALITKGVIVGQCNNTLKARNISRDQLYPFIAVVPSGIGELIIREADGWVVIKP